MKWDELEAEPCSLARTVAVIGDRWSLLILRECFSAHKAVRGISVGIGHHPAPAGGAPEETGAPRHPAPDSVPGIAEAA
jgi:hypothetical protein